MPARTLAAEIFTKRVLFGRELPGNLAHVVAKGCPGRPRRPAFPLGQRFGATPAERHTEFKVKWMAFARSLNSARSCPTLCNGTVRAASMKLGPHGMTPV